MLPHQKQRKGVHSLLRVIRFLRKFILNCAEILKPLWDTCGASYRRGRA